MATTADLDLPTDSEPSPIITNGRSIIALGIAYAVVAAGYLIWIRAFTSDEAWAQAESRMWLRFGAMGVAMAAALALAWVYRARVDTHRRLLAASMTIIIVTGVLMLASRMLVQKQAEPHLTHYAAWGIVDLIILHVVACLIVPWTAKESVTPLAPLMLIWAAAMLVPQSEWYIFDRVVGVIISPALLLPGVGIAAWRHQRRREVRERIILGEHVRSIDSEMSRARIVHDAMFPRALNDGPVSFEYEYQPMAEIGGDYVHVHVCRETGRTSLTLLDVAGHGLAAALTVNRLFGELERIRAENPRAEPSDVMALLNRYVNLTMAAHSLYATGACIMLDPHDGTLKWVNAGHPPAFVRRIDGTIEDLGGTSMLLGALTDRDWDPSQQSIRLRPGEVVIAYTDGAFEARAPDGEPFGIARVRQTAEFNPPPRSWPRFIANAVAKHHCGHAEDDVLIAELRLKSLRVAGRTAPIEVPVAPSRAQS